MREPIVEYNQIDNIGLIHIENLSFTNNLVILLHPRINQSKCYASDDFLKIPAKINMTPIPTHVAHPPAACGLDSMPVKTIIK